jgi:hypothetical protein
LFFKLADRGEYSIKLVNGHFDPMIFSNLAYENAERGRKGSLVETPGGWYQQRE